jgi:hypothetical protein
MAYLVNKTDGTAIQILDGTANVTATSLTLIGRLSTNYGESQNENFVRMLENFALATAPAYPIKGQLWYDTSTQNIKFYSGAAWAAVGSNIVGNVALSGNLLIGANGFKIQETLGNATVTNQTINGNVSFYSNVSGVSTRTLHISGASGLVETAANATTNLGVTTKIYVDSEISRVGNSSNIALAANVAIINANLAIRTNAETDLYARITAANAQIALRDTISRVNGINSSIDTALQANVAIINANLVSRINQTIAVESAMLANVGAANVEIDKLRANITSANVEIGKLQSNISQANVQIALRATISSPVLTDIPRAPTATIGANTTQIATTEFVQTAVQNGLWQGSHKFVSTSDPTVADGVNGDIWFKYS